MGGFPEMDLIYADGAHRDRVERHLTVSAEQENAAVEEQPGAPEELEDDRVSLRRSLWGVTTLVFLVAAVILLLRREHGYAGVTFAVAVSAAINLR